MQPSSLTHNNTTPAANLVDCAPHVGEDGLRRSLGSLKRERVALDKTLRTHERKRAGLEREQRRLEARLASLKKERDALAQERQRATQQREQVRRKERELAVMLTTLELGVPVSADASERRAHPRFLAEVEVGIQTTHNFYAGVTRDISEGGIFIATHDLLPRGQVVELSIQLGQEAPIQVRGEVCWAREPAACADGFFPGVGLRFLDLSPEDQASIAAFSLEREPLLYE